MLVALTQAITDGARPKLAPSPSGSSSWNSRLTAPFAGPVLPLTSTMTPRDRGEQARRKPTRLGSPGLPPGSSTSLRDGRSNTPSARTY